MRITKKLLLAAACLLASRAACFSDDNGTSGGMFLRLNPSAQAAGMSEAMTAVEGNLNSIDFNPAGISRLAGYDAYKLSFSHVEYLEDVRYEDMKFATYIRQMKGFVGLNVKYLYTSDVNRDVWGNSNGGFNDTDYVLGLTYAKALNDADFGVQLKYISEKLAGEKSAEAFAADAGFLYSSYFLPFDMGVSLRNIGTEIGYGSYKDPLPSEMRFGISKDFKTALVSIDAVRQREGGFVGDIGAEAWIMKDFKLRAGYTTLNRYSAGFGVDTNAFSLDYAFSPFSELSGDVHRVSFEVKFGMKNASADDETETPRPGWQKQFNKLSDEKVRQQERENAKVKEQAGQGQTEEQTKQIEPEQTGQQERRTPAMRYEQPPQAEQKPSNQSETGVQEEIQVKEETPSENVIKTQEEPKKDEEQEIKVIEEK